MQREVLVEQTAFLLPMGQVDASASGFGSEEKEKKTAVFLSSRKRPQILDSFSMGDKTSLLDEVLL